MSILVLFQVILFFSCRQAPETFIVRLAPSVIRSSVAYGSLRLEAFLNDKDSQILLTTLTCDGYDRVEWHETTLDEKLVMHMQKKDLPFLLEAKRVYVFQPGSTHLMLLERNREIKEGEILTLTFGFSNDSKITFPARVTR